MSKNRSYLLDLKENWFKCHGDIFEFGLHSNAIAIYCYLSNQAENFHPSVDRIAEKLGMTSMTVTKYLNILVKHNLIRRFKVKRAKGQIPRNAYEFVPRERWLVEPKPVVVEAKPIPKPEALPEVKSEVKREPLQGNHIDRLRPNHHHTRKDRV